MKDKVMKPWTPMKYSENGNNITTEMWGRKYISGDKSFLESIISQGEEILAGPVRLVGTENGKDIEWGSFINLLMNDSDESMISIVSSAQSDAFLIDVAMNIEYDGCIDIGFTIAPQGTRPGKVMGYDVGGKPEYKLTRLWLEIPLKNEIAKVFHMFPNSEITVNGKDIPTAGFTQAGKAEDVMHMPFKEQVFIGNDNVGFCVFAETDEGRQIDDKKRAIECVRKDDEYVLRIHLLDSEPYNWIEKDITNGMNLLPITYRMGFIVTPLRPFPVNPYEERAVHIDCFKKIPNDMLYDEYLLSPYEDTNEIMFDRLKRLGVNTLYLHEKWNDLQNSPVLTKRTADKVKLIIEEAHKRDIKVIPYFGYEISTLSPYWPKLGEKVIKREFDNNYGWQWFRYPSQRASRVCFNSEWKEIYIENIEKLYEEFEFDGIYLDSAVFPWECANEKHGCGYRDRKGNIHNTYTIWSVRELMKKLYAIAEKHGGILNNHTCGSFNLASMAFSHSLWEGETIQQPLMLGQITEVPENYYRAVINGRNFGIPVNMLCYSNPPIWTFSWAVSQALLFGCLAKSNDAGKPLEEMSAIWNMLDRFEFDENTSWHYYFNNDEILSSDEKVKISYYKNKNKYLVICCNTVNEVVKTKITFKNGTWEMIDKLNMDEDNIEEKIIEFDGFDYKILLGNIE